MIDEIFPKCPTCEHKLEHVFDYPLIEIKKVERLQLPEHIKGRKIEVSLRKRHLPSEVRDFFKKDNVDELYENKSGSIYIRNYQFAPFPKKIPLKTFTQYDDALPQIKNLIEKGEIGEYLHWLESKVGKVVKKEEFLGREDKVESALIYSLEFVNELRDYDRNFDPHTFILKLDQGEWGNCSFYSFRESFWGEPAELAKLNLEGKLATQ